MDDVERAATLSPDGLYRYTLTRRWGPGRLLRWIMLNPSTADATVDDPTIRRCIGFARDIGGYDAIMVLNLYAHRSTSPKGLWLPGVEPTGGERADALLRSTMRNAALDGNMVIAAWGANAKPERVAWLRALPGANACLHHLGLTKGGQPRHPLYLPSTARPTRWDAA